MQGLIMESPRSSIVRACLVIESGVIVAVTELDSPVLRGIPVRDYGDSVLFPGLIDTHCHLCLPGDGRLADPFLADADTETIVETGCQNARSALAAGITTVRDLGSPQDNAFEVRDRLGVLDRGDAPRIFASGAPITVSDGHLASFGGAVCGERHAQEQIGRLAERGADVIKVIASGSGGPGQSLGLPFSPLDLTRIVEWAHQHGLPATAHVTSPEAIEACLIAGFDGLEHAGFWMGDGSLEFRGDLAVRMRDQGTFVAPTIQAIYRTWRELEGQTEADKVRRGRTFEDTVTVVGQLAEHGIRFVSGTDAGWLLNPFGDLPLGLELMAKAGVPVGTALEAATTTAAFALGMEGRLGCLSPGAFADVIVLPGNPRADLGVLRHVEDVFVGGQRVDRSVSRASREK